MKITKFLASSILAAGLATSASAGTIEPLEVESEVEEAVAAASSSSGIAIPLLLLLLVGAAVAGSDTADE